MDVRVLEQALSDDPNAGGITLEAKLDLDDVSILREQGARALEIERSLPPEARTMLGDADDATYIKDFIETRATNDALEYRNIVPVATPHVKSSAGLVSTEPFTCTIHVHPRPDIGLISLEPIALSTKRIPKPGFSMKGAEAGESGIEYLEDEKVLRMEMIDRLDSDLPESAMRALGEEYQDRFERELANRGIDPTSFRATHQLDEEQYAIMLTRRALADTRWNYVLDAVFVGNGFAIDEQDLLDDFEADFPGHAHELMELHELRNELWKPAVRARRAKALDWLRENVMR